MDVEQSHEACLHCHASNCTWVTRYINWRSWYWSCILDWAGLIEWRLWCSSWSTRKGDWAPRFRWWALWPRLPYWRCSQRSRIRQWLRLSSSYAWRCRRDVRWMERLLTQVCRQGSHCLWNQDRRGDCLSLPSDWPILQRNLNLLIEARAHALASLNDRSSISFHQLL